MMLTIYCESLWKKGNKKCTVLGMRSSKELDYTFVIRGWNPLPCKEFKGSYTVLANWLMETGWEREKPCFDYAPDLVQVITD